jgi:hypothetical protein
MSRRIFKDVEEALARQIRRITFHDNRTVDEVVLEEAFDPLTGEVITVNVEPDFYDSSADTGHRQYPHIFIRLMKVREDIFTNRAQLNYGNLFICPNEESPKPTSGPKAFAQVIPMGEGDVLAAGNDFTFSNFRVAKVQPGHLLRLLNGNNIGTYVIDTVTRTETGPHTLTVTADVALDLPNASFNNVTRLLTFLDSVDFTNIKVGDVIEDVDTNTFNIIQVDANSLSVEIDGTTVPNLTQGAKITRSGNMFQTADSDPVCFLIMDPTQPVIGKASGREVAVGSQNSNGFIPIDAFYMIRIDNKEKDAHTEVLNRMWEEFNPPRGGLPTIVRTEDSAEELLTADLPAGGSTSIQLNNADFNINDNVFLINDFTPTKSSDGGYEEVFTAKVVDKVGTDTIVLDKVVPDTFTLANCAKVVSNAEYQVLYLHFVDHRTRDVEGAQYWVHEFDFWIQFFMDRQGTPAEFSGNINGISTPIEDLDGVTIIPDI